MPSLYSLGWRRGSVLSAPLPLDGIVVLADGQVDTAGVVHERWLVVTQDCDLDQCDVTGNEAEVELRPVFQENPPAELGIRSRRLRLGTGDDYIESLSPRPLASPAALNKLVESRADRLTNPMSADHLTALTTWLGLRYDRPAVPNEFVQLATSIAAAIKNSRDAAPTRRIRDVLMQFGAGSPPFFSLFAVVVAQDDVAGARAWLAEVALMVPKGLGIADKIEAATAHLTSLHLVETAYAADSTDITWRSAEPTGAY